jgi:hypothetical protein
LSRESDILTGCQTVIEANVSFNSSTDARVLRREELIDDEETVTVYVFLSVKSVTPIDNAPQICDFRTYQLEIVVKFSSEGRTLISTTADSVNALKGTYSDALKTAMKTLQPSPTVSVCPISNVFDVRWISEDLNYKEPETKDTTEQFYRIQQVWNLYTYES